MVTIQGPISSDLNINYMDLWGVEVNATAAASKLFSADCSTTVQELCLRLREPGCHWVPYCMFAQPQRQACVSFGALSLCPTLSTIN